MHELTVHFPDEERKQKNLEEEDIWKAWQAPHNHDLAEDVLPHRIRWRDSCRNA